MIKKLIVLAATAVFSLNASADYVQYNFANSTDFFVENTTDKSIAFYDLHIGGAHFDFSGAYGSITSESSNFWGKLGPTNFSAFNHIDGGYNSTLSLNFGESGTNGIYNVSGNFAQTIDPGWPQQWISTAHPISFSFNSYVTLSPVNPQVLGDIIDMGAYYGSGLPHYVPTQNVPEPGSLALIGAGVLGALGAARRRKK